MIQSIFFALLLAFTSLPSEELSCKDPDLSGIKTGVFSHYDQSPTDGTILWHQEVDGVLPWDMSGYAGVVAVEDCSLVGRDAWVRITDDRALPWTVNQWRIVKIFDCSGHDSTSNWMAAYNILGELGYYLANEFGMYGEYNIQGEIAFEAPPIAEACGYSEMYSADEQENAWETLYIEDSNPPPIITPLPINDDPQGIPALLTAMPSPTRTTTPTALPDPSPTPTALETRPISTVVAPTRTSTPLPTQTPTATQVFAPTQPTTVGDALSSTSIPVWLFGALFVLWVLGYAGIWAFAQIVAGLANRVSEWRKRRLEKRQGVATLDHVSSEAEDLPPE